MKCRFHVILLYLLFVLFLTSVACTGQTAEPGVTPTISVKVVQAASRRDNVEIRPANGDSKRLPAPDTIELGVGDGVTVDEKGQAKITFPDDLLVVEVMREGDLTLKQATINQQEALIDVFQTLGTFFNDFNADEAIDARITIESEFAVITATGTQFLVVQEAGTDLEWIVAVDAEANDLAVTANGTTRSVTSGKGVWVAPIGPPGPVIDADMARVQEWLEEVRDGQAVEEIGEIVWDPADLTLDLEVLPDPLPVDEQFSLQGVVFRLVPGGTYTRADCNGDGTPNIRMEDGRIQLDIRAVTNRVRQLDVSIINDGEAGAGALTGYSPAGYVDPVGQPATVGQGNGVLEVLHLESTEGPYHFAELQLQDGCFLGLNLSVPGLEPTATPTSTPTPTATPEPTRPPTQTCGPPSGWVRYTVQLGDTLYSLAIRTGTTVADIQQANCLVGTEIIAGQELHLPLVPTPPTRTAQKPQPPADFTITEEDGALILTWEDRSTNEEQFCIDERRQEDDQVQTTCTGEPNMEEVVLEKPAQPGTYRYSVRACGQEECSEPSPVQVVTVDDGPPGPPLLVAPEEESDVLCDSTDTAVSFQWQPVDDFSGIAEYELEIRYDGQSPRSYTGASGSQMTLTVPCSYQEGEWRMRAVDGVGNVGNWSELRRFYVELVLGPPLLIAPEDGSVILCGEGSGYSSQQVEPAQATFVPVTFSWEPINHPVVAGYDLKLSLFDVSGSIITENIFHTAGASSQLTLDVPCNIHQGVWQVRAVDGAGNVGVWPEPRRFDVATAEPELGPPLLIAPEDGSVIPCGEGSGYSSQQVEPAPGGSVPVTFSWEPVDHPTVAGYDLNLSLFDASGSITTEDFFQTAGTSPQLTLDIPCNIYQGVWQVWALTHTEDPGPPSTSFTFTIDASPLPEASSIKGTIRYQGRPLTDFYSAPPNLWMRDEQSGESFPFEHSYNQTTGEYTIFDVPAGEYGIQVNLDADGNGWPLPNDLYAWTTLTVPVGQGITQHNIDVLEIIHLTSPADNASVFPGPSAASYPVFRQGDVVIAWDALPQANTYEIIITEYQHEPTYKLVNTWVKAPTTDSSFVPNLPTLPDSHHYQLRLYAYDNGNRVGLLMINYESGIGWDFRFRVEE